MSWSLSVACSFAARGIHSVLLPWLLVGMLASEPASVGLVQGAAMLAQALTLMLLGGLGDRFGARRVATLGQLAASLPPALLFVVGEEAAILSLLVYAVLSGGLWGILCPARDSLLARGASENLLRPTAGFTLAQFAGLLGGIALASSIAPSGAAPLLAAQSCLYLMAAATTLAVTDARRAPAGADPVAPARPDRIHAGMQERIARELIVLSCLLGLFSAGPFAVWVPLWAGAETTQPARAIGLLLALFPLGTIVGSLALRFATPPVDKRSAVIAAHLLGSLGIACAGLSRSFWVGAVWVAIWGLCGAVFINCGRALLLESRPRTQHGRVLANCQLALLVSSPLGAVLGGLSAQSLGAKGSMCLLGVCAAALALALVGRPYRLDARSFSGASGTP